MPAAEEEFTVDTSPAVIFELSAAAVKEQLTLYAVLFPSIRPLADLLI